MCSFLVRRRRNNPRPDACNECNILLGRAQRIMQRDYLGEPLRTTLLEYGREALVEAVVATAPCRRTPIATMALRFNVCVLAEGEMEITG
jgi:hypothetical protein